MMARGPSIAGIVTHHQVCMSIGVIAGIEVAVGLDKAELLFVLVTSVVSTRELDVDFTEGVPDVRVFVGVYVDIFIMVVVSLGELLDFVLTRVFVGELAMMLVETEGSTSEAVSAELVRVCLDCEVVVEGAGIELLREIADADVS